jgi:formylglycine-generating enzyme required for sulfatase activity
VHKTFNLVFLNYGYKFTSAPKSLHRAMVQLSHSNLIGQMTSEPLPPKNSDAVLGGKNTPQRGVILGGLEGIKQRLKAPQEQVRADALHQAINYGKQGWELVIASVEDESLSVSGLAYHLLLEQPEPSKEVQEVLANYDALPPMVFIPGGRFLMGAPETEKGSRACERPQHRVKVSPFFMSKFPVTQDQYEAVMGENPSKFQGKNHPVEQVSRDKAIEFCQRLSQKTMRNYRLPSEAEWEYACRAGTATPFFFGETINTDLVNYNGKHCDNKGNQGKNREKTTPVGSFSPNAFGLFDLHGNVYEWCQDLWHANYVGAPTDGSAWIEKGHERTYVIRGGSWFSSSYACRSAHRDCDWRQIVELGSAKLNVGLRVVYTDTRRRN